MSLSAMWFALGVVFAALLGLALWPFQCGELDDEKPWEECR